jgi:hypothetical protein
MTAVTCFDSIEENLKGYIKTKISEGRCKQVPGTREKGRLKQVIFQKWDKTQAVGIPCSDRQGRTFPPCNGSRSQTCLCRYYTD